MSSAANRPYELEQFMDIRQDTLGMAKELTQAQSQFTARPGAWSAGEILDHLVKSQTLYQEQFEKLAAKSRRGERPVLYLDQSDIDFALPLVPKMMMPFLAAPLTILNAFVPSAVREGLVRNQILPATNPKASEPGKARPVEDLRNDLKESIASLERFFDSNADLPFDGMRVCHPALGNNSIPALLRIIGAHEERHQSQLSALLGHPSFPGASGSQRPGAK